MEAELIRKENLTEVEQQKYSTWGKFGVILTRSELELQAAVQGAILKFIQPVDESNIVASEESLKVVKKQLAFVETKRKEITSKLDEVTKRLMAPEKSLGESVAQFSKAILDKKLEIEKNQKAKKEREEQILKIRQDIANCLVEFDIQCKNFINQRVAFAYEYALENNILPVDIDKYIEACSKKYNASHFVPILPKFSAPRLDNTEVEQIIGEEFKYDSQKYVDMYQNDLQFKFSDYETAYLQKESALALSVKEAAEKALKLQEEKQNAELAANIATSSVPLMVQTPGVAQMKALKTSWDIDMEETAENAYKIIAAFIANKALCEPKLQVTKWFVLTPKQMAGALCKVKNQDEKFAPAGIIFKEVSKL